MFLEHQISILERFLKDCVTLKSEISALISDTFIIFKNIHFKIYYNIAVFTVFSTPHFGKVLYHLIIYLALIVIVVLSYVVVLYSPCLLCCICVWLV